MDGKIIERRLDLLAGAVERIERKVYFLDDFDIPLNRVQAASYLGCTPKTIDNYRQRGLLRRSVKNGMAGFLLADLNRLRK